MVADSSVAPEMSGTLIVPARRTSPFTWIEAFAIALVTVTRRLARVSAAGSGAGSGVV